jgi:hypothetical protein
LWNLIERRSYGGIYRDWNLGNKNDSCHRRTAEACDAEELFIETCGAESCETHEQPAYGPMVSTGPTPILKALLDMSGLRSISSDVANGKDERLVMLNA